MKRSFLLWAAVLALSACASSAETYKYYLSNKGLETQLPESFQHCHGYGCKYITRIQFTQQDWAPIEAVFSPLPQDPQSEREAIKKAIALFEQRAGEKAGTAHDRAGTFKKIGKHQHDCVDESTNTTIYLSLLKQKGLIAFHRIEGPSVRLPFIDSGRWPHQSAVISEVQTSHFYAVDSWFHDNGHKAEIIRLKEWKDGWKPEEASLQQSEL